MLLKLQSRNRDLWTTIWSLQHEKEHNSGIRFTRSTQSENRNTRWLYRHKYSGVVSNPNTNSFVPNQMRLQRAYGNDGYDGDEIKKSTTHDSYDGIYDNHLKKKMKAEKCQLKLWIN
ncbi:hypothetical protein LOAG_17470 [Loa loa]|uniref:Uncharacterized protein n=1 Tax=Loa loa TaxID=7209 RepID=A0A1S0UJ33_LOALO|nr:hypothetical protein LOAG_17470 [Loa loa]EJD75378.1 hypothetical protein LOAG_17470 [Loa loa]